MSRIGLFVKEARKWLSLKQKVVIVMGNESCDLDSAVCAIGLAFLYTNTNTLPDHLLIDGQRRFLPIMNTARNNFPLKTEVTFFMKKHGIDIDDIVCCDEVPTELLSMSSFILVDHHVVTANASVDRIIEIFDHRPLDAKNAQYKSDTKITLRDVGSCATLIAEKIRELDGSFENQQDLLQFLHGPIVLDTVNFLESAGRARRLDIEINAEIEKTLDLNETNRKQLFNELVKARSDVSALSAMQLLSKDLKIISNDDKSFVVAIPGFPMLVEEYLGKENVLESLNRFGSERNCDILILMGLKEIENGIRRDIGLLPLRNSTLTTQIIDALSVANSECLQLQAKVNKVFSTEHGLLFEQKNVKASRKQILPIIQQVLDEH